MEVKHHTKLTARERDLIALLRGGGMGPRAIARELKRSHSTIIAELKNNSFCAESGTYYVAIHAQAKAEERAKKARRRHPLKDPATYSYVLEHLKMGWSPEQVSGRLRKEAGKQVICLETIYTFVYTPENKRFALWEYLPRKQKKRKKKHGRRAHKVKISDRVSIHKRPAQVETRKAPGHWEGDTVEGKGHRTGIWVGVERMFKLTRARKLARVNSEEAIQAQREIFSSLPRPLRKTLTLDNGRENYLHSKLKELGINTFFCDPYASYQKGTVENTNGLIRRYLPKGTDFADLTQEELDDMVEEINNRPKKALNYSTPNEVLEYYLKDMGGRIQTRM